MQPDVLFTQVWVERYGLAFQLSICSYYLGHYQESLEACQTVLKTANVPESFRAQTLTNIEFPKKKLEELAAKNRSVELVSAA
jgi:hypothetical protein